MIKILSSIKVDFYNELNELLFNFNKNHNVTSIVKDIIKNVVLHGDEAVIRYSNKFDAINIKSITEIVITNDKLKLAFNNLDKNTANVLLTAKDRIESYHKKQIITDWSYTEKNGTMLGQKITPIAKVGLYVPGGKASYPSSVLMNAIPAKIAGVEEIIMVTPTPNNSINNLVLASAYIVGIDKVFTIGGAQAIAALAYGTKFIPKVDKIVGPGNAFVAAAKKEVFGTVGIDMIAGPSEILIICDGKTNPDWIAMDLFSQAEHDEDAQSILLCPDTEFITQVQLSIKKLLPTMNREKIIRASLKNRGALILTKNIDEAIEIANHIAPEHLELSVDNPQDLLNKITNAGAIFMGRNTCEALGDYCAGPNHVLPTAGTAKFASPLGVEDFYKKSSLIMMSEKGANELGEIASTLAEIEGLDAHAKSARFRINN